MKKLAMATFLGLGGLMVGPTVLAQSLKLKRKKSWYSTKESAISGQEKIKRACGADISVGFNEQSFKSVEEIERPWALLWLICGQWCRLTLFRRGLRGPARERG